MLELAIWWFFGHHATMEPSGQQQGASPPTLAEPGWWQERERTFAIGELWEFAIGRLRLRLERCHKSWRLHYHYTGAYGVTYASSHWSPSLGNGQQVHLVLEEPGEKVRLTPVMLDKPVICHGRTPFAVAGFSNVRLLLRFPLALRLEVGNPWRLLHELPMVPLHGIWDGANTLQGESCYAQDLDVCPQQMAAGTDADRDAYTVYTTLEVANRNAEPFELHMTHVPLPALYLYADTLLRCWSNGVRLVPTDGARIWRTEPISTHPPEEVVDALLMSPPRIGTRSPVWIRAVSSLFTLAGHDT